MRPSPGLGGAGACCITPSQAGAAGRRRRGGGRTPARARSRAESLCGYPDSLETLPAPNAVRSFWYASPRRATWRLHLDNSARAVLAESQGTRHTRERTNLVNRPGCRPGEEGSIPFVRAPSRSRQAAVPTWEGVSREAGSRRKGGRPSKGGAREDPRSRRAGHGGQPGSNPGGEGSIPSPCASWQAAPRSPKRDEVAASLEGRLTAGHVALNDTIEVRILALQLCHMQIQWPNGVTETGSPEIFGRRGSSSTSRGALARDAVTTTGGS